MSGLFICENIRERRTVEHESHTVYNCFCCAVRSLDVSLVMDRGTANSLMEVSMYNPFQFNNPFPNPYQQQMPQPYQQPVQVTKVNGENGARAYQIGPNSSALLLDESGLFVWLVVTDGAGYKTVSPYDITPHQAAPVVDYSTLEERIKKLEGFMNEFTADSSTASGQSSGKPGPD